MCGASSGGTITRSHSDQDCCSGIRAASSLKAGRRSSKSLIDDGILRNLAFEGLFRAWVFLSAGGFLGIVGRTDRGQTPAGREVKPRIRGAEVMHLESTGARFLRARRQACPTGVIWTGRDAPYEFNFLITHQG